MNLVYEYGLMTKNQLGSTHVASTFRVTMNGMIDIKFYFKGSTKMK